MSRASAAGAMAGTAEAGMGAKEGVNLSLLHDLDRPASISAVGCVHCIIDRGSSIGPKPFIDQTVDNTITPNPDPSATTSTRLKTSHENRYRSGLKVVYSDRLGVKDFLDNLERLQLQYSISLSSDPPHPSIVSWGAGFGADR